jgi:hypothetical protein
MPPREEQAGRGKGHGEIEIDKKKVMFTKKISQR